MMGSWPRISNLHDRDGDGDGIDGAAFSLFLLFPPFQFCILSFLTLLASESLWRHGGLYFCFSSL